MFLYLWSFKSESPFFFPACIDSCLPGKYLHHTLGALLYSVLKCFISMSPRRNHKNLDIWIDCSPSYTTTSEHWRLNCLITQQVLIGHLITETLKFSFESDLLNSLICLILWKDPILISTSNSYFLRLLMLPKEKKNLRR